MSILRPARIEDLEAIVGLCAEHAAFERAPFHAEHAQRALGRFLFGEPPRPADAAFVVYCAGPHCNGADKAAIRLARLGRRVKKMIGGVEGWKDEGFSLIKS